MLVNRQIAGRFLICRNIPGKILMMIGFADIEQ